jgi:Do/DeqQ family serine protease
MEIDMLIREPWSILLWLAAGLVLIGVYFWASAPNGLQFQTQPATAPQPAGANTPAGASSTVAVKLAQEELAPSQAARIVPQDQTQVQMSFAPVVGLVAPAVVNLYSRKVIRQSGSPFYDDPYFRHFFGLEGAPPSNSMPRERIQSSLGSGVIVRPDGIIVTNNHVVADGDEFIVALSDRREFEAEVILADERSDLAVLRIDAKGQQLPFLDFRDSDTLLVGDLVLAIGNPFGVGQTVTSGIVSALARTQLGISDYQFFIQTDAAVNPGNSGGALVTLDGKLVGINTAIFTRTGGSVGIGFAIPSNMVRVIVETAADGGKLARPWLGATGDTITAEIAESLGLDRPRGVLLRDVTAESPAGQAGLQAGDVVLSIGGFEINDPQSLRYRLATVGVGKAVRVDYLRKGQPSAVDITLVGPPEDPPRSITKIEGRNPLSGATVGNLSPAFAEELRIDEIKGVVVLSTERGSPAARVRVRPGDIVLSVNGETIDSVGELGDVVESADDGWKISLKRGDEVFTRNFGG